MFFFYIFLVTNLLNNAFLTNECSDLRYKIQKMQETSYQQNIVKNNYQSQVISQNDCHNSEQSFPIFANLSLFCNQNNKARLLCSSQNCKKKCGMICRQQNCSCLPKDHANCQFLFAQNLLSQVYNKKKRIPVDVQKALLEIESVYQQAINKLSEDRAALLRWQDFYGLTPQEVQFLEIINSNQRQKLTGEVVYRVKKSLLMEFSRRQVQTEKVWLNGQSIQEFWKQGSIDFYRVFKPLTEIVQQYDQQTKSRAYIRAHQRKNTENAGNMIISQSISVAPISQFANSPKSFERRIRYQPQLKFEIKPNLTDQVLRKFYFDEQQKEVKKINDQWEQVTSLQQLPKYGRYYFDVQIIDSKSNLAVGIIKESVKNEQKVYTKKQSIKYFAGGTLWKNGEYTQGSSQIQNGKTVRVSFDIANRNISWWVDGQLVKATKIDQQFLKQRVFASIQAYYRKTKFKIL